MIFRSSCSASDIACPKCDGAGYYLVEPSEHCSGGAIRCECQIQAEVRDMLRRAHLPPETRSATVKGFEAVSEKQKAAKHRLTRWVKEFDQAAPSLYLWGGTGVGKSHLAAAAIRGVATVHTAKRYDVAYWGVPDLLAHAKATIRDDTADDVVELCIDATLLVLDDYGAGQLKTDYALDILYRIINGRMGRPTIITSNLNSDGLDAIEPRIADRIRSYEWLELDGESYRGRERKGVAA